MPGQRLLEVELGDQLEVSRAPIREAFLVLQRDGLVDMRPHRGATVAIFSDQDIEEIYRVLLYLARHLDVAPPRYQAACEGWAGRWMDRVVQTR